MVLKHFFLTLIALVLNSILCLGQVSSFIKETDTFLKKHVSNGLVNYQAIHQQPDALDNLIGRIESTPLSSLTEPDKKAFLVNSYNLLVIYQLVNNYPVNSPMDIVGFFDQTKFSVGGESITLNHLENEIIRPTYQDSRLHFVLVCGAKGCPILENFAYTPEKMEKQIEAQTIKAMSANPDFIRIDGMNATVSISEIFRWYADDFKRDSESNLAYVNQYREVKIPESYKVKFYPYDWNINAQPMTNVSRDAATPVPTTNLQLYTAGSLLKKGQIDVTLFNSIYTESETNWLGVDYEGFRTTFASSLVQFTYGISKNARVNIGVDLNIKSSATNSNNSYSNMLTPLQLQNNDTMRFGLAYIAPKIKISPFRGANDFSIQSSFITSFVQHPEGGNGLYWLEWDRHIWWNQFFYSTMFANDKFQLFTEFDLLFRFAKRKSQTSHVDLPISAFISWFPTQKLTAYVMTQHVPRFVYNNQHPAINDWVIGANYTQSGLGFKYQVLPSMNIEFLYTNFWRGVNNGKGETFNIGIKYVH